MVLRFLLAVVVIFFLWTALDVALHWGILGPSYAETADLWRPMDQMNRPLQFLATALIAVAFTAIYACLIRPKSVGAGALYGLLFGLGGGISMGLGTYSVMPITLFMAMAWLVGMVVECLLAGIVMGLIIRPKPKPAAAS